MDRRLLAVTLAILAVGSGCAMPASGGETPTTVTPAPLPDSTDDRLAPGVSDAGLVASQQLLTAHERQLADRSYTLVVNRTRLHFDDVVRRRSTVAAIDGPNERMRIETVRAGLGSPARSTTLVVTPERAVLRRTVGNDSSTGVLTRSPLTAVGIDPTQRERLRVLFDGVEIDTVSHLGGGDHRLVGDSAANTSRLVGSRDRLKSVDFGATVTASGLVESYRLRYSFVRGRTTVTVVERARIIDVGTTVVDTTLPEAVTTKED